MRFAAACVIILLPALAARAGSATARDEAQPVDIQAMANAVTQPKPLYLETPLSLQGKPNALLVAPASRVYQEDVRSLQDTLKEVVGHALPVKLDTKVADDDYRKHHLVALGNLSTNRVARRMYTRQYAYCDRVFPGPGQFVIRTIHNPFGWGKNVVLLGGSDASGVHAATSTFVDILKRLGHTRLPPLIVRRAEQFDPSLLPRTEPKVDDPFEKPLEFDDGAGAPRKKRLHPIIGLLRSSDKSAVWRMLDEAALGYILKGNRESAKRYKAAMVALAEHDTGCASRNARWFQKQHMIWQYWNQLEECGLFTDAERLTVDRFLIRLAFAGYNAIEDPGSRAVLVDSSQTINNHWSGLWLAQAYYGVHYLYTYYRSPEVAKKMRRLECFVDGLAGSFKPDEDATGYQEGFQETKVKLLLHAEEYEFFNNGNARLTADLLLMPLTSLGTLAAYGDAAGPRPGFRQSNTALNATSLMLGDGQYAWAAYNHRRAPSFYKGTEGLHSYTNEVRLTEPREHVGLRVQPMDPTFCKRWGKPEPEYGFDKLTLRAGWQRTDDYLMLQGIGHVGIHPHYDVNVIVRYQSMGQDWLVDDSYTKTGIRNHSMLTIAREGQSTLPARGAARPCERTGRHRDRQSAFTGHDRGVPDRGRRVLGVQ